MQMGGAKELIMKKFKHIFIFLSLFIIAACTSANAEETNSTAATLDPTLHALTITATAEGWNAPESVPAGWTRVTLNNESEGLRQAAFLRLDDDKSMDDVFAAIEAGMEGPAPWMVPYGGVSGVLPGGETAVSLNLAAGQYIVIDPVPEPDGIPGMAKGYFMPLVVEESDVATAAPAADLSVELVDYAFNLDYDAISAGSHTLKVSNSGPQEAHELVVVKLDDGASIQDFLGAFAPDAPDGPPPGTFVAGTAAFNEQSDNYLEVTFEAGATYGIVCFLPSTVHGGQPHFMHGMVSQFTVPAG